MAPVAAGFVFRFWHSKASGERKAKRVAWAGESKKKNKGQIGTMRHGIDPLTRPALTW
jgi:hypothetical protein